MQFAFTRHTILLRRGTPRNAFLIRSKTQKRLEFSAERPRQIGIGFTQYWEVSNIYRKTFLRSVQVLSKFYLGADGNVFSFVYGGEGMLVSLFVCLFGICTSVTKIGNFVQCKTPNSFARTSQTHVAKYKIT